MKRSIACALLLLAAPAAAEQVTLTVLYTSDLHANVLPWDDVRQARLDGSIAQVARLVDRLRADNPCTVVLDGGDAIEGTALAYYALTDPDPNALDPTVAAMNAVGYDAAVLGNHEFDFGLPPLRRAIRQSRFPWLAANLSGSDPETVAVSPELTLERCGVRVAVLGLTNPNVPHWSLPERWRGLEFEDPLQVAARRLPELRRRADLVIVVAHTGFERDLASGAEQGSDDENFAWRLAQLPGIDLLLTGHTHRAIPPRSFARTVIAQPGRFAESVTRVDLELSPSQAGWQVARWRGDNLPTATEAPQAAVIAAVESDHTKLVAELARPLGELTGTLTTGGVPTSDDAGLDLVHAAQLAATGAQLSLASPLASRPLTFPAGPMTPRLAHALYPYPNTLVVARLSGSQLKDVLEHAVSGWSAVRCEPAGGPTLLRDPAVPSYAYDTLEGATYIVDPAAANGQRIRGLRVDGRVVAPEDSFTVAINSYRAAGGGDFPHLRTAERIGRTDRFMVEVLIRYLERTRTLTPTASDNWAFTIPLGQAVAPRTPLTTP